MNKKKISEMLLLLRGEKTREEVASSLSISVSTLQMYENAQRVPRDEIKIKISKYYKRSVEEIFFS